MPTKADVLWAVGVAVAIAAQFVSNLGNILQKRSHNDEERRPKAQQRPYAQRAVWWVGMSMILFGSFADFVALTLAPQSVVAALGCLTLVATVIWAPLVLGERLSVRHYIATGMIVVGVVLAVVYGPHSDGHYALAELLARFTTARFAGYVVGVAAVAIGLYAAIVYVESRFDLPPSKLTLGDYYTEERWRSMDQRLGRFHRVSYGMLSGVMGAQVMLLGKFIGELIAITLSGNTGTLTTPATYLIVIALAGAVVGQIHFVNEGELRFQSLYVLPVFQATWTLFSVVGGLVVFDEWDSMGTGAAARKRRALFALAILLTLFAMYYLMNTPALPEDRKRAAACFDKLLGSPPHEDDEDEAAGAGRRRGSSASTGGGSPGAAAGSGSGGSFSKGSSAASGLAGSEARERGKGASSSSSKGSGSTGGGVAGATTASGTDTAGSGGDDEGELDDSELQGSRGGRAAASADDVLAIAVGEDAEAGIDGRGGGGAGGHRSRGGSGNQVVATAKAKVKGKLRGCIGEVDWNRTCTEIWSLEVPEEMEHPPRRRGPRGTVRGTVRGRSAGAGAADAAGSHADAGDATGAAGAHQTGRRSSAAAGAMPMGAGASAAGGSPLPYPAAPADGVYAPMHALAELDSSGAGSVGLGGLTDDSAGAGEDDPLAAGDASFYRFGDASFSRLNGSTTYGAPSWNSPVLPAGARARSYGGSVI